MFNKIVGKIVAETLIIATINYIIKKILESVFGTRATATTTPRRRRASATKRKK